MKSGIPSMVDLIDGHWNDLMKGISIEGNVRNGLLYEEGKAEGMVVLLRSVLVMKRAHIEVLLALLDGLKFDNNGNLE